MMNDLELASLARAVGESLLRQKACMCTAESCTGGWIAKVCTDIPGGSAWFERGWVTYGNQAKQDLLAVPQALLVEHGAVSEPVARAMAQGAYEGSRCDYAVAVTGIAGPDGGSPEKPVGLVWLAFRHPGGLNSVKKRFPGDREAVRRQTVAAALRGLLGYTHRQ